MCRNRCDGLLLKSFDIGSEDWYLQPPSKASFTINFDNNILLYQYSVHLYICTDMIEFHAHVFTTNSRFTLPGMHKARSGG